MTTAPETPAAGTGPEDKEALQLEAAELEADVQEAKEDAKEARAEGDTERADRLEAKIAKVEGTLTDIQATLKALADRPFHPAPEASPSEPADQGTPKGDDVEHQAVEDKPKEPVHRFGSSRWFGKRAYED